MSSQKAKLSECPKTAEKVRIAAETPHKTFRFPAKIKYTIPSSRRTPAKIRKVTLVPTDGIVTKVGRKVPIMLPIVLKASSFPTVRPLSSIEPIVYLTSDGVTVPSRNSGKTKISIHETNAAMMR